MAKTEENVETVNIRMMYKNKDSGDKVVPFLWNKNSDYVLYAPEGSGREFRLTTREFLDQHVELVDEPTVGRNI